MTTFILFIFMAMPDGRAVTLTKAVIGADLCLAQLESAKANMAELPAGTWSAHCIDTKVWPQAPGDNT